jgi:hypothetical protein
MRHFLTTLALAAVAATTAGAQQTSGDAHAAKPNGAHRMVAPCPLELEALWLTPAQQTAMDSLRADHAAIMKALMRSHHGSAHDSTATPAADKAPMESGMRLTLAAARSILTDAQRRTFDAAASAHAAEMKSMSAKGSHDGKACCSACMDGGRHGAAMKHEE